MTGRQSSAVERALAAVAAGASISAAARAAGVALSSVRRALRAAGVAPAPRGRPSRQA